MNDTKVITTIITTFRRPASLKRAIESVLKQTYPHFQICVYDNDSDDETEKIVSEFINNDSRIKYYKHPRNIGMIANYAFAYSKVDTPFFAFLSDDDFYFPHFFETAMNDFKQYPKAGFSACGVLQIDEKSQSRNDILSKWPRSGYYKVPDGLMTMVSRKGIYPVPTGIVFQREIIKEIAPNWDDDLKLFWDPDYLIQIAARFPIIINQKTCCHFTVHDIGFANSIYNNQAGSNNGHVIIINAIKILVNRALQNEFIKTNERKKIANKIRQMIYPVIFKYLKYYIQRKQFQNAFSMLNLAVKKCGLSTKILSIYLFVCLSFFFPNFTMKTYLFLRKGSK